MLTRWIITSANPMASGAKPAGALPWVAPMMMNKNIGHHHFHDEARDQAVLARRMRLIAVGRKTLGNVEAGSAAANDINQRGRGNGADHLRDDIGGDLPGRKAPACCEARRHRGIEMAAGEFADGTGHVTAAKPERQR